MQPGIHRALRSPHFIFIALAFLVFKCTVMKNCIFSTAVRLVGSFII